MYVCTDGFNDVSCMSIQMAGLSLGPQAGARPPPQAQPYPPPPAAGLRPVQPAEQRGMGGGAYQDGDGPSPSAMAPPTLPLGPTGIRSQRQGKEILETSSLYLSSMKGGEMET